VRWSAADGPTSRSRTTATATVQRLQLGSDSGHVILATAGPTSRSSRTLTTPAPSRPGQSITYTLFEARRPRTNVQVTDTPDER